MKTFTLIAAAALTAVFARGAVRTVASGETLAVTDATVASFADGIVFADDTGIVEFDTSAAPTMAITGAGTVKKTSSADWTMATVIDGFTGDYVLEGGGIVKVTANKKGYFGGDVDGSRLVVKSGNTLDIVNIDDASWGNWAVFDKRAVHISGTGHGGEGAIKTAYRYSTWNIVNRIVCDADATLNLTGPYYIYLGGLIDVQDHTLSVVGKGSLNVSGWTPADGGNIQGSGTIRFDGSADASSPTLAFRQPYPRYRPGATAVIRLVEDSTLLFNGQGAGAPVRFYPGGIEISGQKASIRAQDQNNDRTKMQWTTNNYTVSGPVTLGADGEPSILDLRAVLSTLAMSVGGAISGNGSIVVTSANKGRVQLMGENSYTGSTTIDNAGGGTGARGQFLAFRPTSLPDYASVTCRHANLSVALDDAGTLWTPDDIAALADKATFTDGAWIGLDTSWATTTVQVAFSADLTADSVYVGGVGPRDIEIAAPRETPVNLMGAGAVTRVKGPGTFKLGGVRVSGPSVASDRAVVEFSGGVKAVAGRAPLIAGWTQQSAVPAFPTLRIADASLVNEDVTRHGSYEADYADAIVAGGAMNGIVEILDGAVVSNRLLVGASTYGCAGSVFQRGGDVTALGTAGTSVPMKHSFQIGHLCTETGSGSHVNMGYYELSGGTLVSCGDMAIGNVNLGYFYQSGGAVRIENPVGSASASELRIGYGNGYGGALTIRGGTFSFSGGQTHFGINSAIVQSNDPIGIFAVDGPEALFDGPNAWSVLNGCVRARTYVNLLNGGTLRMKGFRAAVTAAGARMGFWAVNFDGGVFKPQDGNDIFAYGTSGTPATWPDHVYVYGKGAVIDTSDSGSMTHVPFEDCAGGGVRAIPWTDVTTKRSFRPIVLIDGDGAGATAEAEYDSVAQVITGIRVTAPGAGYTRATARLLAYRDSGMKFSLGDIASTNLIDCVVGANAPSGPFVKRGANTFSLYATNTWKGATVVEGGTLKAGCDWAIPAGTAVVLAGGDLDFNGKTGEVASVTYRAGGGRILNAGNVVMADRATFAVSADELAAGKTVSLSGDVDLSRVSITVTGDASVLAEDARYAVATTDGTFSGTPVVTLDPSFGEWTFRAGLRRLTLSIPRGTSVFIR